MDKFFTLRVQEPYYRRIKRIAASRGMSVTSLIVQALQPIVNATLDEETQVQKYIDEGFVPQDCSQSAEKIIALVQHSKKQGLPAEVVFEQFEIQEHHRKKHPEPGSEG